MFGHVAWKVDCGSGCVARLVGHKNLMQLTAAWLVDGKYCWCTGCGEVFERALVTILMRVGRLSHRW